MSLYSLVMTFVSHFGSAVLYAYILESMNFNFLVLIPVMIELTNLFYISKMVGITLRIRSIDLSPSVTDQGSYISWTQIKICKFFVLFLTI
jgi:hypothetical protein